MWVRGSGKAGDNALPYKAAVLVGNTSKDGTKTVQYATGGNATTAKVRDSELVPRNPPGEPRPDNSQLLHLTDACVLENVAARFDLGDIYTWTSHVLTAVNPLGAATVRTSSCAPAEPRASRPAAACLCRRRARGAERAAWVAVGHSGDRAQRRQHGAVMACLTGAPKRGAFASPERAHSACASAPFPAIQRAKRRARMRPTRFGNSSVEFDAVAPACAHVVAHIPAREGAYRVAGQLERTYHVFYALLEGTSAKQKNGDCA